MISDDAIERSGSRVDGREEDERSGWPALGWSQKTESDSKISIRYSELSATDDDELRTLTDQDVVVWVAR